jgi:hypothetical protein
VSALESEADLVESLPIFYPTPGTTGTNEKDAKDVVEYLGFLMQVMYNLPHQIEQYRARKKNE